MNRLIKKYVEQVLYYWRIFLPLWLLLVCVCNEVPEHCGDNNLHDPFTQFCHDGKTYYKCGGTVYDPTTQFCYQNEIKFKCGVDVYDPVNEVCYNSAVLNKISVLMVGVTPTVGGSVLRNPTLDSLTTGEIVTVTAKANGGYVFTGWSGASTSTNTSITFAMDGNKALTANFEPNTFVDDRDGSTYRMVKIGDQMWMAENLKYRSTTDYSSSCYYNDYSADNCNKYGRKYSWAMAMSISNFYNENPWESSKANHQGICPTGWHLPSEREWDILVNAVGGNPGAGIKLKSTTGWHDDSNGTDEYGFSALASYSGYSGSWWTANQNTYRYMSYQSESLLTNTRYWNIDYHNIRCIRDDGVANKHTVIVSSAGVGAFGSGDYACGATVTISTGTAPSGQKFKNWTSTSNGVIFANADHEITTFTMPTNDVTVTAVFERQSGTPPVYGTFTDNRDNTTYKTVKIGNQTWMAENLSYNTADGKGSWCSYDCDIYGRAYDWYTAKAVCPAGWHLPTRVEWNILIKAVGGNPGAGTKLKSTNYDDGTDDYGFAGLPGGAYTVSSSGSGSYAVGSLCTWWADAEDEDFAYSYSITDEGGLEEYNLPHTTHPNFGRSVRCVAGGHIAVVFSAGIGASGTGNYLEDATVSIQAGTSPSGQKFKNWATASNGVTLVNVGNTTTSFTMPKNAVTVTAVFDGTKMLVDERDGHSYNIVTIGNQTWMAENLNYLPSTGNSWCRVNSEDSCTIFGRLYDWATAMDIDVSYNNSDYRIGNEIKHQGVCPAGWHLPSFDEWNILAEIAGGNSNIEKLKSTSGWNVSNDYWSYNQNGTNDFGFSMLPGGVRRTDGSFNEDNDFLGAWWTKDYQNTDKATCISTYQIVPNYANTDKGMGASVRCIMDVR